MPRKQRPGGGPIRSSGRSRLSKQFENYIYASFSETVRCENIRKRNSLPLKEGRSVAGKTMASSITEVKRSGKTDNCVRDKRRERIGHANYERVVGNLRG